MQSLKVESEYNEMNNIDVYEKGLFYNLFKRTVDLIGSLFGLIFFSPVMLVIAIAIKLESKGPVFFIQERIGLNGKSFKMYKFRSMVVNAEELKESLQEKNEMSGPMFKIKDDPRITTIGKFIRRTSIDELPQFINVFLGEMSIVGPRPNLPNEVSKFTDYQKRKLLVKPGLTCYWQVMGRNNIDFEEWMELDVRYLRERSTWVDIKLIISTFKLIFGDNNAR